MKRPGLFEVSFEARVAGDFQEAFTYYDTISAALADNFRKKFEFAVYKLSTSPYNYLKLTRKLRRIRLEKFPYILVYKINKRMVIIAGLFHQASRPSTWRKN